MSTETINAEHGTVSILNKGEIDMQIATAHKYPRSIKQFRDDVLDMVTLSEEIAAECIYVLPRGGKTIEGASARFAEVVASAWGNSRAGARIIDDRGDFVVAQGVFHDLQKNVAITYEVQRRIVDKQGRRFQPDMIGVTANAACSIALRNAILKGVPKAFWSEMYEEARKVVMGTVETLPNRRDKAFKAFQNYGVTKEQIFAFFGITGSEDLGQDQLLILRGVLTAIKDGDTTPEQAFNKVISEVLDDSKVNDLIEKIKSAKTVDECESSRKSACDEALKLKDQAAVKRFNAEATKRKGELNNESNS